MNSYTLHYSLETARAQAVDELEAEYNKIAYFPERKLALLGSLLQLNPDAFMNELLRAVDETHVEPRACDRLVLSLINARAFLKVDPFSPMLRTRLTNPAALYPLLSNTKISGEVRAALAVGLWEAEPKRFEQQLENLLRAVTDDIFFSPSTLLQKAAKRGVGSKSDYIFQLTRPSLHERLFWRQEGHRSLRVAAAAISLQGERQEAIDALRYPIGKTFPMGSYAHATAVEAFKHLGPKAPESLVQITHELLTVPHEHYSPWALLQMVEFLGAQRRISSANLLAEVAARPGAPLLREEAAKAMYNTKVLPDAAYRELCNAALGPSRLVLARMLAEAEGPESPSLRVLAEAYVNTPFRDDFPNLPEKGYLPDTLEAMRISRPGVQFENIAWVAQSALQDPVATRRTVIFKVFKLLGLLNAKSTCDLLVGCVDSSRPIADSNIRAAAISGLGYCTDKRALPILLDAATPSSVEQVAGMRETAVISLGIYLGPDRYSALPVLQQNATSDNRECRVAAYRAICEGFPDEALRVLASIATNANDVMQVVQALTTADGYGLTGSLQHGVALGE